MNVVLDKKIEQAWAFTWDKLYYKETKLIYDYITENKTVKLSSGEKKAIEGWKPND